MLACRRRTGPAPPGSGLHRAHREQELDQRVVLVAGRHQLREAGLRGHELVAQRLHLLQQRLAGLVADGPGQLGQCALMGRHLSGQQLQLLAGLRVVGHHERAHHQARGGADLVLARLASTTL
ncbi:MAG: hypothetical protein U1F56_13910 [Rubrivivax sp.]